MTSLYIIGVGLFAVGMLAGWTLCRLARAFAAATPDEIFVPLPKAKRAPADVIVDEYHEQGLA